MLYRFLTICLFLSCIFQIQATNPNKFSEIEKVRSVASFPVVYGWLYNDKNDKWITKDNEIKNIDKFSNYYIISFFDQAKRYIAIIKEEKIKNELIINSYILDYDLYESNITRWEEQSLIKLPVLKHHTAKINKNEIFTTNILGVDDLSNLEVDSRSYFVLQYKFFTDSTVKFIFYKEQCTAESCTIGGLNVDEKSVQLCEYLGKDEMYNKFFYKTTIQFFTDFIDSPLNK